MIGKLRRKMVLIVMSVVTVILLAIFFTMLFTTKKENERMSISALNQALDASGRKEDIKPQKPDAEPDYSKDDVFKMRLPVLVVKVDQNSQVTVVSNQLHFIEQADIDIIVKSVMRQTDSIGILTDYTLRYMKQFVRNNTVIAFIDISMEQEMLKTQVMNSLFIGIPAMLLFFVLSLVLAKWAVKPVETAWERQKQFIADASHELKTPLTVILSNAEMLGSEQISDNEKNPARIEHIHSEALRMKSLVQDMLLLARSDNCDKTDITNTVDFSDIVTSAVLTYEPVIYDENKQLIYEIENGLHVNGDESLLVQAVHVLLDNAQKYSPQDSVISVYLKKSEHKTIKLMVTNQGSPLADEELEIIFHRFYTKNSARSDHGSFGLGLSIAKTIVTAHKGKIWAETDHISLNTFCITLPLVH